MKRFNLKPALYVLAAVLLWASGCTQKCDPIDADLLGKWERVDGNNSPFNGMVVDFTGNASKLTTVPATAAGFKVDDVKWRNVAKAGEGVYTLEDRDSGGGYIKSRILILADGKEMMLSGTGSVIGNYQKWQRK